MVFFIIIQSSGSSLYNLEKTDFTEGGSVRMILECTPQEKNSIIAKNGKNAIKGFD